MLHRAYFLRPSRVASRRRRTEYYYNNNIIMRTNTDRVQ